MWCEINLNFSYGAVHKWHHGLRGGILWQQYKIIIIKKCDEGGGGVKSYIKQWNSVTTNSVVNEHSVITNRILSQIDPVITKSVVNEHSVIMNRI